MPSHIRFDEDGFPVTQKVKKAREPLRRNIVAREVEGAHDAEKQPEEEFRCTFVDRSTRLVIASDKTALVVWYPHDGSKSYHFRVDNGPYDTDCEPMQMVPMKRKMQARTLYHLLQCMFCEYDMVSCSMERFTASGEEDFVVYEEEFLMKDFKFRNFYADMKMLRRIV